MSDELRELDEFCAIFAMGWRRGFDADGQDVYYGEPGVCVVCAEWEPTTSPADSFAVLQKCFTAGSDVLIMSFENETFERSYSVCEHGDKSGECFPTLPLAIARFAKALYSK